MKRGKMDEKTFAWVLEGIIVEFWGYRQRWPNRSFQSRELNREEETRLFEFLDGDHDVKTHVDNHVCFRVKNAGNERSFFWHDGSLIEVDHFVDHGYV